ncbi:DDE-type integrase/transposase/recombinase [Microbacterium azadirachtae]|uniref:DDE-type integrase/transposase/recombinase n=1 Tax=Microbacterium azadirachtae TaxID=582680 RepID=UPI000AF06F78
MGHRPRPGGPADAGSRVGRRDPGRKPRTTTPARTPDDRPDLVERRFRADRPNRLWVADITYVRTMAGFCYTAFVTDVFERKIVDWATRATMRT